jgi:putative membrane protein
MPVAFYMREEANPVARPDNERAAAAEVTRALSIFALVRTAFSSERALLAWMRTSVSLYSFGFSITKFVDYLERQEEGSQYSDGPRRLGLALICMGILVLVLGAAEHFRRLVRMKQLGLPPISRFSLPVAAAVALFVIGAATLVGIASHWPP